MAEQILHDKTSFGHAAHSRSKDFPQKADVDLFPEQLILKCGTIEIFSDGKPQHTSILIDGKAAKGIYSLKINFNTQRLTKIELGVFLDEFNFQMRPKGEINGRGK